jgi:putative ABC transport system permease protein
VLGRVAGVGGIGFANLIARVLLKQLNADYRFHWMWSLLALMGTAALTVGTGWMASHRILGQKPLEVLREE